MPRQAFIWSCLFNQECNFSMSDQITINVIPDSFVTVTAEEGNENVYLNPITLNQGIINHSTTHASGGSDELLHNALGGLNGGTSGQFYHLTSQEYSNLVTGQVIRPSDTGLFYASSNPSGFITGISDIVYTTGDQNIAGLKNFYTRPQVNGIGVLLSGEGGGGGSASGDYLPLSGGTLTGSLSVSGDIISTQAIIANTLVAGVDVITVSPFDDQITLDLTHANKLVRFNFATDGGIHVHVEAILDFPINTVITLTQIGAGKGILGGDAELILNSVDNGYSSAGQYAAMQIIKVGSNTWDVIGGVV